MPEEPFDLDQILEDALRGLGRVNILVAGKTGVGKSTLINAVFQGEMATTGQGRPVTTGTRLITKEGIPLGIFDTRGLETASYKETIGGLAQLIKERRHMEDPDQHIHVAWLCVVEDSRRIEQAELELAGMLSSHDLPILVVITKAKADDGFRAVVQGLLPDARNVVRVRSKATVLDDGHRLEPMGLETLIEATNEIVPEGQRNALAAAQRVSVKRKIARAHKVVTAAAATAATIGATPIPFADAAALVPLQVGMLAKISTIWGLPLTHRYLATLASGAVTGAAATMIGRAAVSGLLKLIPGAGSVVGGAVSAGTAAALTTAFGEAYIATLCALAKDPERPPSAEDLQREFKERLKRGRLLGSATGD
jgi:uncharacterized protein (DUF697 family)